MLQIQKQLICAHIESRLLFWDLHEAGYEGIVIHPNNTMEIVIVNVVREPTVNLCVSLIRELRMHRIMSLCVVMFGPGNVINDLSVLYLTFF